MQDLIEGLGSLHLLPKRITAKRIALITYGRASQNPEIIRLCEAWQSQCEIKHLPFSTPLLEFGQVIAMAEEVLPFAPEAFVSIGGGAVLDLTKALKAIIDGQLAPQELLSQQPIHWRQDTPHIAVPTTAGTGSEATSFATIYRGGVKHSIDHPHLSPDLVVLDPALLSDLSRKTMVYCGFDAMAQAMESIWSIHATDESLGYATEAITLIRESFKAAVSDPSSDSIAAMQRAAYLSGKAINISRTTLAHALSYYLSARYGLPHGLAVYLNLPRVIRHNAGMSAMDCTDPRGIEYYQAKMQRLFGLFGVQNHEELASIIEGLGGEMGVSTGFREHGVVGEEAIAEMVQSAASSSRSGNNPRRISSEALLDEYL